MPERRSTGAWSTGRSRRTPSIGGGGWVDRLLALPADALRLQKALLARWRRVDLDTAVALSTDAFVRAYATGEPRRAMQAFFDRRAAARRSEA